MAPRLMRWAKRLLLSTVVVLGAVWVVVLLGMRVVDANRMPLDFGIALVSVTTFAVAHALALPVLVVGAALAGVAMVRDRTPRTLRSWFIAAASSVLALVVGGRPNASRATWGWASPSRLGGRPARRRLPPHVRSSNDCWTGCWTGIAASLS